MEHRKPVCLRIIGPRCANVHATLDNEQRQQRTSGPLSIVGSPKLWHPRFFTLLRAALLWEYHELPLKAAIQPKPWCDDTFMVPTIGNTILLEMDRHCTIRRPWHVHFLYKGIDVKKYRYRRFEDSILTWKFYFSRLYQVEIESD